MQKANAEKERPDTPDPFPLCKNCEQGFWNTRFRGFCWTDDSPAVSNEMVTMEKPLCKDCKKNPTFGRSPYCASCMATRSNKARKGKKTKNTKPRRAKKAGHTKDNPEKSPSRGDTAIVIDFGKYAPILRKIESLAEEEVRSVESQIIYMLKISVNGPGETAQRSGD
jgi:hypothetical protein